MTNPIIGTWRLLSQHTRHADGTRITPRGENPVGILMYDEHGNMSVQLMRTEDYTGSTDMTDFNVAMGLFHSYFGTYTLDTEAQTVTHHIIGAAYPDYVGTDQVRHYELKDNRLYLQVLATGDDTVREIVWERLNAKLSDV